MHRARTEAWGYRLDSRGEGDREAHARALRVHAELRLPYDRRAGDNLYELMSKDKIRSKDKRQGPNFFW